MKCVDCSHLKTHREEVYCKKGMITNYAGEPSKIPWRTDAGNLYKRGREQIKLQGCKEFKKSKFWKEISRQVKKKITYDTIRELAELSRREG